MMPDTIRSCATKDKIITTARSLFSKYGFHGTSIRDIASACDVNVASINYHFVNKENLFWEIIRDSYTAGAEICRQIALSSHNVEEFSLKVYDHFCSDRDLIRNTMKLLLSDGLTPPDNTIFQTDDGSFGPPGGQYFAQFLVQEIPYKLKPEAVLWGVKSIFGTIIHWSTMCATTHMKSLSDKEPLLRPEQIRKDVQQMVKSTIDYMKRHSELFKELAVERERAKGEVFGSV